MKEIQYKKRYKRILLALIGVVGIAAILYFSKHQILSHVKKGELVKMLGMEMSDPTSLSSYQSVSGVLRLQHWKTKQGVPVYFVEVPTLPMVDIEMVFDAGSARNGSKGALAYLTNILIAEGTANLTADQVAENFENVGAQYQASSQRDMATLSLRSLTEPHLLSPALETLTAILGQATFPESGFLREKQIVLTALKKQAQSPAQVASKAFYSAIYPNEPYSNWVLGAEEQVKALTLDDIKSFYKLYYNVNNAVIAIVGNLKGEEANAIAEKLASALPAGEKPADLLEVKNLSQSTTQRIQFPSSQTHILMGEPLIKKGDPDYYALFVGNHILGGNGSVSRIFNTIRSQHGLAYSAYSNFQPMRVRGPYVLGCQTRNEEADKALSLLQSVLKEFVEKGPTDKELQDAKLNILGGYALSFDSNALILQQISALGFYGLPLNHFDQFKKEVEKLTTQDIQKVFQNRVQPDNVAIIMVGQNKAKD